MNWVRRLLSLALVVWQRGRAKGAANLPVNGLAAVWGFAEATLFWLMEGRPKNEIATTTGVHRTTVYRYASTS